MSESTGTHAHDGRPAISILTRTVLVIGIAVVVTVSLVFSVQNSTLKKHEECAIVGMRTLAAGQTDYYNNSSPHTFAECLAKLGSEGRAECAAAFPNNTGDHSPSSFTAIGESTAYASGVGFIDPALASGIKCGYTFVLDPGEPLQNGVYLSWKATSWPLTYGKSGKRSFLIDESGILRGMDCGGIPCGGSAPVLEDSPRH